MDLLSDQPRSNRGTSKVYISQPARSNRLRILNYTLCSKRIIPGPTVRITFSELIHVVFIAVVDYTSIFPIYKLTTFVIEMYQKQKHDLGKIGRLRTWLIAEKHCDGVSIRFRMIVPVSRALREIGNLRDGEDQY